MRYIRTKDNKIFDLEKIKKNLKKNNAYPHLYDWKLEPTNDKRGSLRLSWMADFKGSKSKPEKLKSPRECAVILDCESSEYKQADTIEELCDCLVRKPVGPVDDRPFILKTIIHRGYLNQNNYEGIREELKQQYEMRKMGDKASVYLAIWDEKGLIYVAKMNDKGELELL